MPAQHERILSNAKKKVDVLNDIAHINIGCLRPTRLNNLYALSGIAPPDVKRKVAVDMENLKQMRNRQSPMSNRDKTTTRDVFFLQQSRYRRTFLYHIYEL